MIYDIASRLGLIALVLSAIVGVEPVLANDPTARIVSNAEQFLAALTPEQRQKAIFSYDDAEQRARWSNFPTGFVPRAGISLKQMSAPQRDAAMHLLASVLSPMGLEKVNQIRQADDDFKANGSKRGPGGRGGPPPISPPENQGAPQLPTDEGAGANSSRSGPGPGGPPAFAAGDMFGSDLYYIAFLGTPSTTHPWMLQFGGHHLALNITVSAAQDILTPTLTGAQPAKFTSNGKLVRPLGRESDKALQLLRSLDPKQLQQAVLPYVVPDLVLGPGQDGKKIVPEGLKAATMSLKQQALLLDLIGEWAGIVNETAAAARMAQLKLGINDTWFAWSGPISAAAGENISAYYRIQGPNLVIEYAPQHDEPTNHVHTIYRDPSNDYGGGLAPPLALNNPIQPLQPGSAVPASLDAAECDRIFFSTSPPTAATFAGGTNGWMIFDVEQYSRALWSDFPVRNVLQ